MNDNNSMNNEDQPNILLVDDTLANLRVLSQILAHAGYHVRQAQEGELALISAQAMPPDLILLDIKMPKMNGFEVCRRLKADIATQHIPVIFISAMDAINDKIEAFAAGGVDYITKPFQIEEVLARVEAQLKLLGLQRQLQQQVTERDILISKLDATNRHLQQEITERQIAEEKREEAIAQLRESLRRTESLYQIARATIIQENLPTMLQMLTASIADALPADRVTLITVDMESQKVLDFVKGGPGVEYIIQPDFDELMAGLTGWVIQKVQPVLSVKGQSDPRESKSVQERRVNTKSGAIMVVPLYYKSKVLGTLTAINRPEQRDFNQEDISLLSAIASQVAIALENARLAEETAHLKEFNESIVQGIAEAILITNAENCFIFANPAAEALLGYPLEELLELHYETLIPEAQSDKVKAENTKLRSGDTVYYETNISNRNGENVPVIVSAHPRFQNGDYNGAFIALTNITRLKQAEASLRQRTEELEAQNAELDAFAHTVAHDLKTPLTSLIGFSFLLSDRFMQLSSNKLRDLAQTIAENARKMNNIINELLLLSSVRSLENINTQPLDMYGLIYEAQKRLRSMVQEYQPELIISEEWPIATGYSPWVEEIWVNYFSNALKYGGSPPRVEFGGTLIPATDTTVAKAKFWVKDNGPGITAEECQRLFTPFERLHNVRAEGHGLGLSIVRRIVEKLGGEVGVESEVGKGSTFWFTLPAIE